MLATLSTRLSTNSVTLRIFTITTVPVAETGVVSCPASLLVRSARAWVADHVGVLTVSGAAHPGVALVDHGAAHPGVALVAPRVAEVALAEAVVVPSKVQDPEYAGFLQVKNEAYPFTP